MDMRRRYLFTCLIIIAFTSASCQSFPYQTDTALFKVFDKEIRILTHQYGTPQLYFLSLHDNEDTGVKAAFEFMRIYGASITELQYGGHRNIVFNHESTSYEIDPNRIFSIRGIHEFYRDEAPVYRTSAFADTVLKVYNYQKHGYIITLHNNTDSVFSIFSYKEGQEREKEAAQVFINPEMDADDFLIVTELSFFEYLKQRNINVVLQDPKMPDDGSLSVYAQVNKIPYVNIEVQHRHIKQHLELIKVVNDMMQAHQTDISGNLN